MVWKKSAIMELLNALLRLRPGFARELRAYVTPRS